MILLRAVLSLCQQLTVCFVAWHSLSLADGFLRWPCFQHCATWTDARSSKLDRGWADKFVLLFPAVVLQVAQQLPLIRAELGDQQALLSACNQFLEDMAERHLNLLLQQQTTARTAASRPNTPTAAGAEALALQAYGQLEQQLQEVSAQLELQREHADELLQQKDALNKQLRVVTMEREELKQQMQGQEETSAASAQLQSTLDELSEAQEKLTAAEAKLDEALDSNKQLMEQLQHANTAVEVAKASALAATSSATAETHAQLQEASARAASFEAQLLASEKNSAAVADSNKVLQQQLRQAHVQGGRLITMNRQLMKHAEKLEGRCQQQGTLVSALKEDKAAMAAELGRIYVMLQDMAGAQQRQQKLQQQLLEIIAQQQQQQQYQVPGKDTGDAAAAGSDAGSTEGAVTADQEGGNGLVKVLSSAMLGVAMPIMGQFMR